MKDILETRLKSLFKIDNIVGIYEYGSSMYSKERDFQVSSTTSVLDFLFIVKRKTYDLKTNIDLLLSDLGIIIHHPNLYMPRIKPRLYIEIVVIPLKSNYLANPNTGILLGLSGFVNKKYKCIIGPKKITELVILPQNINSINERFDVFKRCDNGIRYLLSYMWPLINSNENVCDIRRVSKYFFMDSLWVLDGKFEYNKDAIIDKSITKFQKLLGLKIIELTNYIKSEFDYKKNNYLTGKLYNAIIEVGKFLKEKSTFQKFN